MSGRTKRIEAKGLACPQPVVLAKKALEAGGFDLLEVTVDSPAARENVARFAAHAGHTVEGIDDADGVSVIRVRPGRAATGRAATGNLTAAPASAPHAAPGTAAADVSPAAAPAATSPDSGISTLFISSDRIGTGSDELGALLMRGFLATLPETPRLPARIILMNAGVRLAVEGAEALPALRKLAGVGVEVLACGTCLDFYGIRERLAVGRVSNMFEISGILMEGSVLRP